MVKVNGLAMWLLLSLCSAKERSILGKKISKADHIRVQATRLNRMEERMEQMRFVSSTCVCQTTIVAIEIAA